MCKTFYYIMESITSQISVTHREKARLISIFTPFSDLRLTNISKGSSVQCYCYQNARFSKQTARHLLLKGILFGLPEDFAKD